jgi:hypothetical protein
MNIVPGVQMVNMTVMLQTLLLLSPFSAFLLYLCSGTGYKYFERGAQFKDLGTTVTSLSHSKYVGGNTALKNLLPSFSSKPFVFLYIIYKPKFINIYDGSSCVMLYGCQTWSLAWGIFENKVLRRICGPQKA